jgi:thiol-disulfide isomerase/thioredoxin
MADFTVELIDGSSFHLADQRGKVVIINMWATYCGPCVQELPIFQDFLASHKEDVSMLIIHASDPIEDAAEFLQKKEINLPCAIDSLDDYLYNLAGASPSILPHTVILNRRGEIVYNQSGSMTQALLEELYEKAK